jgi:hypothetical protein
VNEFNPIVSVEDNVMIESTDWFNFAKKEPGQPGVFEVDPVPYNDQGDTIPRFAYWNGRKFGPAASTPDYAYQLRFDGTASYVTKFRGLMRQV